MKTRKLELQCPACGSCEIAYTCSPGCCFNHVCADCSTTFETLTTRAGGRVPGIFPPDELPDSTDPTAGCAACLSTEVYMSDDGSIVCAACGMRLILDLTDVTPG
jgi:DNA-directed RNA polymerase subunit RPC12/RpoP